MNNTSRLALAALALLVACGGGGEDKKIILPDTGGPLCDVLKQEGCAANQKCTWIVDATTPQYVGHIGCAPDGTKAIGESCHFGMPGDNGFDDCAKGTVCSSYKPASAESCTPGAWPDGICKSICDQQGADPTCAAGYSCVRYSLLFKPDSTSPAIAGVCDVNCDPFLDNDYDGSAADQKSATTKCPGATSPTGEQMVGCYGFPSGGKAPKSSYSCSNDVNWCKAQPTGFRHRVQCTEATGCGDKIAPNGYRNSCNQGYIPLLYESYAVQTAICTAMCKPLNCYKGNCGPTATSDINHVGASGDACNDIDRVAGAAGFTYDVNKNGDHCRYQWSFEIDRMTGVWLPSDTSDSVGFCFDHTKFKYDSNNDGMFTSDDLDLPRCADLNVMGTHQAADLLNPAAYWGAGDSPLGCVDHATAGVTAQKQLLSAAQREALSRVQMPRPLYDSEVAPD